MTLKEIQQIKESLIDLYDFASGNCDGDESGIYQSMGEHTSKSMAIIEKEIDKIYLRNAMARIKRNRK